MYDLRQDLSHIQTTRENIVAIIESINQPMVAAMGRSAEPAKAYIVGVRNPSGSFSIYVYLYLVDQHESLIYLHDPAEIPREAYRDNELEALGFVESMGFMIDNLNFRKLPPEQQTELMTEIPCFQADLEAFAASRAGADAPAEDGEQVDLSPLEDDVLELEEVAEEMVETVAASPVLAPEGLAKIARMLGSF